MVYLYLRFTNFTNLFIFLFLFAVNGLWIYNRLKKKSHFSLAPYILINLLLLIIWARLVGIDGDESEHLHCSWMVSQGLIPFKDFWEHHGPLLWVILAPVFKILKPSVFIFELSRIFSALIFTAIAFLGWMITKKVWQERAKASLYLLILFSVSTSSQFLWLRPDLFMDFFLLLGIYFSLELKENKLLPSLLAGISFGLAASFIFKQYYLFLLPPIIIFLDKNKLVIYKFLAYLIGLICGISPLTLYLIKNNILNDFILWVFKLNQNKIVVSVFFPIILTLLGGWAAYMLWGRFRKSKDFKSLVLLIALCLSTLSSLTAIAVITSGYYLGFLSILCAVAVSGCDLQGLLKKAGSLVKKSIFAGIFFSLLLAPNLMNAVTHENTYFSEDKMVISELMKYCAGEACLVFLPLHPVFNYDATRLFSIWQYKFLIEFSNVREYVESQDIAEAIINLQPAVITYNIGTKTILLEFLLRDLISIEDLKRVRPFLLENYAVVELGYNKYYIRKDKL